MASSKDEPKGTLMSDENTGVTEPAAEVIETVEPVMVPKERMDVVIEQKNLAEQRANFAEQQAAIRANNAPQVPEKDIYKELGLEEGDLPNVAQQKVIEAHNMDKVNAELAQLKTQVGQAAFALQHTDANSVLQEDFKQLIDSDPELASLVNSLPPDKQVQVAYKFGNMAKKSRVSKEQVAAKAKVDKEVDNATRPLSASAVGGSTSGLSGSTKYASMTGAEIAAMSRKAAQG